MDQLLPVYSDEIPREPIAAALRISAREIPFLPRIVSTGLRDIIVPIGSRAALLALKPDLAEVARLSERWDAAGIHAFALDAMAERSAAHCRNFAPRLGIDEESATGTSNGALACYLFKSGRLAHDGLCELVVEQGDALGLPSEIRVKLLVAEHRIKRVQVGGQAVISVRPSSVVLDPRR